MQTLSDIQFWFARVKVAYATLLNSYNEVAQNGGDIDETLAVRLQAAQTFINTVDWRIENTPEDLVTIAGEIYKIISFIGSSLPDISEFYNSEVGNTNIVVGNGIAIPFATNTIYGKVRLSVPAAVANDPIVVGDNDPRLLNADAAYDDTIVSASINSDGNIVLTARNGSTITTATASILDLSGGGTQDAAISINGFIRTAGDLILDGIVNDVNTLGVLSLGAGNVIQYLTIAQLAAELGAGTITANRAAVSDGSGNIVASTTTAAEIGFSSGVTSNIQTQLNNKQPLDADLTAIAALSGNGLLRKTAGTWGMDTATYLTANQTITLSGDVTGSGSTAIVTTIANDAVTFAKMQNINTARLLGRTTTGAGNIEEITIAGGLTLSAGVLTNTITQYTDAMARLAISSSATGLSYDNTTGVFSLTAGYVIPTTTEQTNWNTAYNNSIVSVGFNTSNGNLTLTQQDGGTLVQDLDGRYLTANEAITLSGDVTGVGTTAISTTIANDAVTFAKMQNISSGVVLGRSTAASGNVEEITIGTGLVLSAGTLSLGTITANRAIVSGVSGALEASTTTATQIGYLSTLTSNVQTQLDGKQTLDATLTALAAIGSSSIGFVVLNGVDSFATRVLDGSPNRITINNGNGSSTNPTIDIASNYTGQSSITTLGTIVSGVWNGSSIADAYILSAANWNEAYDEHINSITWSAASGNLTANQEDGGNITVNIDGRYLQLAGGTMTGNLILNGAPTLALQAATKAYVDSIGAGISPKGGAEAATTGTLPSYIATSTTLTGSVNGALPAQDGVTLVNGDVLLVKNEVTNQYNGIYTVTDIGDGSNPYVLTRSANSNTWTELERATIFIEAGTTQAGYTYYCTVGTGGTLGTTPVTYELFSIGSVYLAGTGIDITGNTISIDSGSIVDSMISASAAITLSKLAATTASRALVSDASGYIVASATTATEVGYLSGVSSAIQTQLNNKQPLDATLTALAAYNTNGILTQTAADTFVGRTIAGVTNRTTITNGDGVSGNPVVDISATYAGQNTITILGTVATGTWQATAIADAYIASASNWNTAFNNMIVSASFNTGDGVLTLTQQDTGSVTVDLDGRYAIGTAISGTAGRIAKFDTGGASIVDSVIFESGGNVAIGGTSAGSLLTINGTAGTSHQRFLEASATVGFFGGANGIISGHNGKLAVRGEAGLVLSGQGNAANMIIDASTGAATFSASVTATGFIGNASTATALQTARNINGVAFDGTANITVTAAAGTLTGTTLNATVISSSLTSVGTIGTGVWQGTAIANAYIGTGIDATKIADGSVTNAEFQYINTLTSNAQTQIDGKQALSTNLTSLSGLTYASTSFVKMTSAGTFALDTNTYLTGNQTITLSGEASGSGATSIAVTLDNASVIGKVLTGYVSGAGVVAATDTILQAIQKLNGNISALVTGVASVSGTTNRITSTGGANPVIDISASYVGQSSITTLGTIGTGVWQATAIADAYISSAATWNAKIGGSGTTGTLALFSSSSAVGNSIVTQSSGKIMLGSGGAYNELLNLYNSDTYKLSLQNPTGGYFALGLDSTGNALFYNGVALRMSIQADGSIITNQATDTGEHFIIGGSARVNGNTTILGGTLGIGVTSVAANYEIEVRDGNNATGFLASNSSGGYAAFGLDSAATSDARIRWTNTLLFGESGSEKLSVSSTDIISYINTNIYADLRIGNYSAATDRIISLRSLYPVLEIGVNGDTSSGESTITYSFANGSQGEFAIKRAAGDVLRLSASGAATFSSTVDGVSFKANGRTILAGGFIADQSGGGNNTGIAFGATQIIPIDGNGSYAIKNLGDISNPWGAAYFNSSVTATSFINSTSSNSFFLLGGGGTVAISDYLTTATAAATYQPLDATLTALAAYNTNGILVQTAANTFTGRTLTAGTGISVTNGDGVSGNPTVAVSSGYAVLNQAISGSPQTASFDVTGDSRVAGKFYIGSNGAYVQEVLVGATYQLQVVDSAGNITVIG